MGPREFLNALDAAQQQRLLSLRASALHTPPAHFMRWWCGEQPLGILSPEHARWLEHTLSPCTRTPRGLVWHAGDLNRMERSHALQSALERAKAEGLLTAWRNERFSFWHSQCESPDPELVALFDVERSGFRFLGMLSHAVHVNGFLPDGRLWVARRARTKATDPGMLDNVTAGGLTAGETVLGCVQRELFEEAGLPSLEGHLVEVARSIRTSRQEPEGWHDEILHVMNVTLATNFVPRNQDGEVSDFMCLSPQEVLQCIEAGDMTADATQSLVQGLFVHAR